MSTWELLALSAALGADLFSVSIPIGMNHVRWRIICQAAVVFGLFHIVMMLTGYCLGHWLEEGVHHVESYHLMAGASWLAGNWPQGIGGMVLAGLGLRMCWDCRGGSHALRPGGILEGTMLMALAFSVSLDALAAGFSLGMIEVDLVKFSVILGMVIFAIAVTGLGLGRRLGRRVGARAESLGGIVLIVLGAHVIWSAWM